MNQTLSGNAPNQTFHLPRFRQYARAHFSEKKRTYQLNQEEQILPTQEE